jgi:hypothetical protein
MPLSRDPAPQRTLIVATGTVQIAAGGSATLVDVTGCGEVDGLVLACSGAPMISFQLVFNIDGASTVLYLSTLAAPLVLWTVDAGSPSKPIALVRYDATNNVYKVSLTSSIRFARSFRLILNNASSATVYASLTAFVHLLV